MEGKNEMTNNFLEFEKSRLRHDIGGTGTIDEIAAILLAEIDGLIRSNLFHNESLLKAKKHICLYQIHMIKALDFNTIQHSENTYLRTKKENEDGGQ